MHNDFAVVKNSVVINVVIADEKNLEPVLSQYPGALVVQIVPPASIGWTYENGKFAPPAE
ncbi:MAG: hypothetical protein EOM43_06520 [Gammaproteobacteria bacterium]|nr:hypothetical protein [Gammaproteobacteria bacterium]